MRFPKIKKYQMVTRVDDFLSTYVKLFPEHTAAGEVFSFIRSARVKLTELLSARAAIDLTVRACSKAREAARGGLLKLFDAMHLTANAVGVDLFYVGPRWTNQKLLDSGRGFAEKAEPLKDQLVFHGMPVGFMDNLKGAVGTFEGAIRAFQDAKANRTGIIDQFEKTLDDALSQVTRLEALVWNTLANDVTVMAAWNAARRIEQPRARKSPPPPDAAASTA